MYYIKKWIRILILAIHRVKFRKMKITVDKTLLPSDHVEPSLYRKTVYNAWLLRFKIANKPLDVRENRQILYMVLRPLPGMKSVVPDMIYGSDSVLNDYGK